MSDVSDESLSKEEQERMLTMRHIEAAARPVHIRFAMIEGTRLGKSFKLRCLDEDMMPTLQPGDVLVIGGVVAFRVRVNDLVYFHVDNQQYRVRRVVGPDRESSDVAFYVADAQGRFEERITDRQIVGIVTAIERDDRVIEIGKPLVKLEGDTFVEKLLYLLQQVLNKITSLFHRDMTD